MSPRQSLRAAAAAAAPTTISAGRTWQVPPFITVPFTCSLTETRLAGQAVVDGCSGRARPWACLVRVRGASGPIAPGYELDRRLDVDDRSRQNGVRIVRHATLERRHVRDDADAAVYVLEVAAEDV